MHKFVFWFQIKAAALELLLFLLAEARCSDKTPNMSLSQFTNSSRERQWEYAFSEQIMKKKINKSMDWDSSKNIHGDRALRRLIYRYWMHILMKEGVALEESPNFIN